MIHGGNIISGKITFMGESILDMPESKFDGKHTLERNFNDLSGCYEFTGSSFYNTATI